jgi:alpha-glucosidase (family GH31 glycosyl hydrolase)
MENSEYMSFDMTQSDRVTIRLESDKMRGKCAMRGFYSKARVANTKSSCLGRILDGKTMLDLLTEYTSYAGRMLPLPDWVSDGVIAGIQGGQEKTQEIIRKMRQYNIPTAAVFLQDWTGQRAQDVGRGTCFTRHWWNWESDDELYPEWDTFVRSLANDETGKVRVLAYVNPLLVNASMKPRFKRNLFTEAQAKGYLVKSTQSGSSESQALSIKIGSDLQAGILDLTNQEARAWFREVLKEQVWKSGVSGKNLGIQKMCFKLYILI